MQNDVKPVPGPATPSELPQAHMVVENENVLPNENMENARGGGSIYTKGFDADECRPQDLHGAVEYQKQTSTEGKPPFVAYTDLTRPRGAVRG